MGHGLALCRGAKDLRDALAVGIIGCGGIAQVHAEAWSRPPVASVKAVCDVVRPRAEALAERMRATGAQSPEVYEEYAELLREAGVDVVSICLPHYLHAPVTIAAAEAGKHVLCEKPMATALRDADAMIAAARRNNVRLGIVFQSRFSEDMRRVKRALDDGALGRPFLADAWVKWYRDDREYFHKDAVAESWRGKWATEGGALLINQAIHTVDLLQWFMGPVDTASGFISTLTHRIEAEDVAVASLRFRSGALGVIEGSLSIKPREAEATQMQIHGEKGSIFIQGSSVTFWKTAQAEREAAGVETVGAKPPPPVPASQGHHHVVSDFIKALEEDREPCVSGEEGRKPLEIVLAIYKASKESRLVTFPLQE